MHSEIFDVGVEKSEAYANLWRIKAMSASRSSVAGSHFPIPFLFEWTSSPVFTNVTSKFPVFLWSWVFVISRRPGNSFWSASESDTTKRLYPQPPQYTMFISSLESMAFFTIKISCYLISDKQPVTCESQER